MKLNEIVAMALDQLEYGENEFARAYRIGVRGIRTFRWSFIGIIQTEQINIYPDKTAPLPDGFLSEKKVGVTDKDSGEIATFTENTNLSLYNADCQHRDDVDEDFDGIDPLLLSPEAYDQQIAGLSGTGSNNNIGEYRIDRGRNIIVFNPDIKFKSFMLEFNSSMDCNGYCDVPEVVSEAVVTWIVWKMLINKKGTPYQDKATAERLYNNAKRKAKRHVRPLTISRLNQSSRQHLKQVVKG